MHFRLKPLSVAVALSISSLLSTVSVSAYANVDAQTGVDKIKEAKVNNQNATDVRHITFIHTGDIHGDFHPHVNVRDGQPSEGGLARTYTIVKKLRETSQNSFYVHTGDTIQGSAQTLFTRGQAMIDVLNAFGFDAFTPGNWEHTYGIGRFRELFLGDENTAPIANWGIVAVNSYYNGNPGNSTPGVTFYDPKAPYSAANAGNRLVNPYNGKPYRVATIDGVKVGIFGCTTNRGPQIVGSNVTDGITFTNCKGQVAAANNDPINWQGTGHPNQDPLDPTNGFKTKAEIPHFVDVLRNQEGVDMVILLSEAGLAENIYNAETYNGIDIIFSSDMHEETNYPVVVTTPNGGKTLVIEEGEDAAQVGELAIKFKRTSQTSKFIIDSWKWKEHDVTEAVAEDPGIAQLVHNVTAPFESATFNPSAFEPNPFNGTSPYAPLDQVIGYTDVELSRNNYSYQWNEAGRVMPGVIEGSGHDLITDAFRVVTNALLPSNEQMPADGVPASDGKYLIGAIRGFRYVNSYPAGSPITYEDLYHFLSIGPQVAVTELTGGALNNQTESSADSCMNPDVTQWAGGWFFNFSGVTMNFDPYGVRGRVDQVNPATGVNFKINDPEGRVANFALGRTSLSDPSPGAVLTNSDNGKRYRYASYYYDLAPGMVNNIAPNPTSTVIRKIMRKRNTATTQFPPETLSSLALVQVWPTPASDIADYQNVDAVEVVALYIKHFLNGTIEASDLPFPRIHLTEALPDTRQSLGFPTIEPVWGARRIGTPGYASTYGQVNYTPSQVDAD